MFIYLLYILFRPRLTVRWDMNDPSPLHDPVQAQDTGQDPVANPSRILLILDTQVIS